MQDIFRLQFDAPVSDFVQNSSLLANEFVNRLPQKTQDENGPTEGLKDWIVIIVLVAFVVLYALAFSGKLDPFKDNSMLLRFEPVIFILVGYYFGRWPSRQSEKFFRDEIARQALKVDAAQHAKEKAQQEREGLEERLGNAQKVLRAVNITGERAERNAVTAAIKILGA
jgi:hypothetical protein